MDTKKLRQKILDLAIRGKLVPQDPNDEPASVLLERIRAEKECLIREGKLKKKDFEEKIISENEIPFDIPDSWQWVRLINVVNDIADIDHKMPPVCDFGIPYISPLNFRDDGSIDYDNAKKISEEDFRQLSKKCKPEEGDLIFPRYGTIGVIRKVETDIDFLVSYSCATIKPHLKNINPDYILYVLNSPLIQVVEIKKYIKNTTQSNVGLQSIKLFLFPLPPLAEQQRIANEVKRWFAVIDELESNEGDLLKAIEQAKSKILDLAIHGKLVPQDPNDEPAVDLLKRINPKFEPCENELDTTELPNSWCWARLESLSTDSADGPFGSNLKKEHYTINKEVRIIQLSNIGDEGWREENTKYTTFEHLKEISRSEVMPNDIVIAKMMPAGRAILCPNNEKKYVLSSDAVKFHLKEELDCKYILYAINTETFRKQVYENVQGVTRVRTSLQKLRKYCLPLPPYQEQLRIVAKIEELFTILDSIKASLE